MISRLRRVLSPAVRVSPWEVEGPPAPRETRVLEDLRDIRFEPETSTVVLEGVTVERVDFSGVHFWSFTAEDCRFIDCDFSRVQVEWLPFGNGNSLFRDCRFDGARDRRFR